MFFSIDFIGMFDHFFGQRVLGHALLVDMNEKRMRKQVAIVSFLENQTGHEEMIELAVHDRVG